MRKFIFISFLANQFFGTYGNTYTYSNKGTPPAEIEIITDDEEYEEEIDDNKEPIRVFVEVKPSYPGGNEEFYNFMAKNMKYPAKAAEAGIQGTAYIEFVVEKDGRITNVKVKKSTQNKYLDKEAVRFIKSMPKWNPGMQEGEPVRTRFMLPLRFLLRENKE